MISALFPRSRTLPALLLLASASVASAEAPLRGPAWHAPRQPNGILTGTIVFLSAGHGWTADDQDTVPKDGKFGWYTQRGVSTDAKIVEDYGNQDQANAFALYAFNAGATVVPMRGIGYQKNEVIVDNDDTTVKWQGDWKDAKESVYYGLRGAVPFRTAAITRSTSPSARATYTPNIPEEGFYPVYTWAGHGANRVNQEYVVRHSGGESAVRVNHRRIGCGWVWLGTYHFEKGRLGGVEITNSAPGFSRRTDVAIADAIRFGNGIGDIDRGAGVSGRPREEEASRYWIERMVGQGFDDSALPERIVDRPGLNDQRDNVSAPAKMARLMNREADGVMADRVYVSFHSNAGGREGTAGAMGLIDNDDPTPNQGALAVALDTSLETDLALLDDGVAFPKIWKDTFTGKPLTGDYGELENARVGSEFDTTILEVAYHDRMPDAALLGDPVFRRAAGRAALRGIVNFLRAQRGEALPAPRQPDAPVGIRAMWTKGNSVRIVWDAPVQDPAAGDAPTGFFVYDSPNGSGFGNPVWVEGATTTSVELDALVGKGVPRYFIVTAANAAGESLPTGVAGVQRPRKDDDPRVLIVNGYENLDANQCPMLKIETGLGSTKAGGGEVRLVRPHMINAGNYGALIGKSLSDLTVSFDACDKAGLLSGNVSIKQYKAVIWLAGNQSINSGTLTPAEQQILESYLQEDRGLFLSGANLADDLWEATKGRDFMTTSLRVSGAGSDPGAAEAIALRSGIFAGMKERIRFGPTVAPYPVDPVDRLEAGEGALPLLTYAEPSSGTAAVLSERETARSVVFGFPIEAVDGADVRKDILERIMIALEVLPGEDTPAYTKRKKAETKAETKAEAKAEKAKLAEEMK